MCGRGVFEAKKFVAPSEEKKFVQEFLKNKADNPDAIYDKYLKSIQLPKSMPVHDKETNLFSKMVGGIRSIVPFMDSSAGHQTLGDALKAYPFTPEASKLLSKSTVVRDSMGKEIVEAEAEEDPEKVLGIGTGRTRVDIATTMKYSPPLSVMTHELMHSYLDKKGYPQGKENFQKDWEAAKKGNDLLTTIDQYIASSPDYKDEMNESDITQERFAYLAQAVGGAGLSAFPKQLQRDYAAIFRNR
jgi:hypothetical protein